MTPGNFFPQLDHSFFEITAVVIPLAFFSLLFCGRPLRVFSGDRVRILAPGSQLGSPRSVPCEAEATEPLLSDTFRTLFFLRSCPFLPDVSLGPGILLSRCRNFPSYGARSVVISHAES